MNVQLAVLIGDIVASKEVAERNTLQHLFLEVLETANQTTSPATELRITRGDEFEGAYATIADAWAATLRLRLLMRQRGHDLWISVAWGEVTTMADADHAGVQDGPAWWTARSALTDLKQSPPQRTPDNRRTVFTADIAGHKLLEVGASLRDELIAGLDESDATITIGLLDGATQVRIAEALGVTPGVVSRRAHRNGLLTLAESAMIDL